jgi:hypothetical protein
MTTPPPGKREALAFVLLVLTAGLAVGCVLFFDRLAHLRVGLAYAILPILAAALPIAVGLARAGPAAPPPIATAIGLAFIVGGAAFDILATLIHTPDLKLEANPIARALLDSAHPMWLVFVFAGVGQSLWLLTLCALWLALLRHRTAIAASVSGSSSLLLFIKAATGGAELTWRQWALPLRYSELPDPYHLCWPIVALAIASSADRWYLGLGWFGIAPVPRWQVFTVALLAGLAGYFVWLWYASRADATPAPPPEQPG